VASQGILRVRSSAQIAVTGEAESGNLQEDGLCPWPGILRLSEARLLPCS
jgi:hypothetical protein